MASQLYGVRLSPQLMQKLRRSLDVGEKKRDRSNGEI